MPASVERDQYDGLTITLHWLIAALVVILFTLGKVMTNIGNGLADLALKFQLYQLHKSFGFILLALMVVRIGWALARRAPAPIAFRSAIERFAAKTTHILIYLALMALPLTGWALVSTATLRVPTRIFNTLPIPDLPYFAALGAVDRSFYEQAFRQVHYNLGIILAVLVALHVAAALRHQFWLLDGVIGRMAPWRRRFGIAGAAVLLAVLLGAGDAIAAELPKWQVDKSRSSIAFIASGGGSEVRGNAGGYEVTISLDPGVPGAAAVEVVIQAAQLATGVAAVDPVLVGPDILDAAAHPQIVFQAGELRTTAADAYELPGTLSIKGIEKPAVLAFTLAVAGNEAHAVGGVTLNRLDFGVGTGLGDQVAAEVRIEVDLVAKRQ